MNFSDVLSKRSPDSIEGQSKSKDVDIKTTFCYNLLVFKKIIVFPFLISIIGIVILANFVVGMAKESASPPQKGKYISPLPEKITNIVRGIIDDKKIELEPFPTNSPIVTEIPEITAASALAIDITNNKLIFEKNINQRRPIASTLKIMTAILALENSYLDKQLSVSSNAATVGEESLYIYPGEKYTLKEMLYALMLLSANDAAEVIAENIFNRRELFIAMMNSKAYELGLENTKFVNPSGLDGDGEHYGTAKDLAQLARYAMKNQNFREIVKTKEYVIEKNENHAGHYLYNQTNLIGTYPGVEGIKTGYTPDAGLCLVTYANNYGHEIIAVVLGSTGRREDMKKILDFSYKALGFEIPKHD